MDSKNILNPGDDESIKIAGDIIKKGGLVAFPTETVYGLGGNALDPDAASKIYAAKGRPSDNPLIVHIAKKESLKDLVINISDMARILIQKLWPGPLTLIFQASPLVPKNITGGLSTVAVRMPSHDIALKFINAAGGYVAAPSANTSGRPSPTTAAHVLEDLGSRVDMILDGGNSPMGLESTIVDTTSEIPVILRPGFITKEDLENVLGVKVEIDPGIIEDSNTPPKAPGMKYRHYAPRGSMTIVRGDIFPAAKKIAKLAEESSEKGLKTGIICTGETWDIYKGINADMVCIGNRSDLKSIAANIYGALRDFDQREVSVIYSECFEDDGIGTAIMNRLKKAAGGNIIDC